MNTPNLVRSGVFIYMQVCSLTGTKSRKLFFRHNQIPVNRPFNDSVFFQDFLCFYQLSEAAFYGKAGKGVRSRRME